MDISSGCCGQGNLIDKKLLLLLHWCRALGRVMYKAED